MNQLTRSSRVFKSIGRMARLNQQARLVNQSSVSCSIESKDMWSSLDQKSKREIKNQLEILESIMKSYMKGDEDEKKDVCLQNVMISQTAESLLNTIEPHLNELESKELELIFERLNQILITTKREENGIQSVIELQNFINASPVFKSLLKRTIALDDQLSIDCMIASLRALNLLGSLDEEFKSVLKKLVNRLPEMDLNQISSFLISLNSFNRRIQTGLTELLTELTKAISEIAKRKILDGQLDDKNFSLMVQYIDVYRSVRDLEMIEYFADKLLAPDIHLNFENCVELLKSMSRFIISINPHIDSTLNIKVSQLIHKCNSSAFYTLKFDLRAVEYFLSRMHGREFPNRSNLRSFSDPKILDAITPILIKNQRILSPKAKIDLLTAMLNFAKQNVYHEDLLKLIYDLVCTDQKMRQKVGICAFVLLSKYKLPFIDYEHLIELVLSEDQTRASFREKDLALKINFISQLVLRDVKDVRILDYFDSMLSAISGHKIEELAKEPFLSLDLARVHLSTLSTIEKGLKAELERRFEVFFSWRQLRKFRFPITNDLNKIDQRLQEDVYLSNGISLFPFAIYDGETHELVSLAEYTDYFDKVDKIELKANQQMLTFARVKLVRGKFSQHEETYVYHLEKILNIFNIKVIKVDSSERPRRLTKEQMVKSYIEKALNYCRENSP